MQDRDAAPRPDRHLPRVYVFTDKNGRVFRPVLQDCFCTVEFDPRQSLEELRSSLKELFLRAALLPGGSRSPDKVVTRLSEYRSGTFYAVFPEDNNLQKQLSDLETVRRMLAGVLLRHAAPLPAAMRAPFDALVPATQKATS